MKTKQIITLLAIIIITVTACKKNKVTPIATENRAALTKDSIFLYAKEIYLWNTKLPSYEVFNPRKYTYQATDIDNYDQELFEITKFSNPYEYQSGDTYPKYSYIMDQADKNPVAVIKETSSVDLEGNGNDVGIRFDLYGNNLSYTIYINAVYENSPAAKAGFVRGDKITKINGISYGTNYTSSKGSTIRNALENNVAIEGIRTDGTSFVVSLTKTSYKSSPIYKTNIIAVADKKIGYLAYARFSDTDNSASELDAVFTDFAKNGVTDLVIDLRYNGGGYISTAEHLANLIAPASANGGIMFTEHYNETMQANNAKILSNQPLLKDGALQYENGKLVTYADVDYSVAENTTKFDKKNGLSNVQNVFFLVTDGTASASELVINSLKPYMNVKLVGSTTYGKPVGFFPVTIENKYDVYFSMFESKNSLGQGAYYDGMVPDYPVGSEISAGARMYDFGDVNEEYFKKAIDILAPGAEVPGQIKKMATKQKTLAVQPPINAINPESNAREFKGMVENRLKRKQ